MKFGLEQHIIDNLIAVFEQHSKVDKAIVFGSRAKGNYRPDSDIDIAIKGQDLNTDDIIAMSVAFEEKGITHKIDLINYDTIKEPDLKDHIDRVGIELYSRWKEFTLTEMGTLKRGKSKHRPRYAFHLYGGIYPFIQTGQIREASKYITHYEQTYSQEGLAQSKLWHKGTLCITIAANIAEIAILSFDACFPDSVLGFIPNKDKCDLDFVFYTLKYFKKELQQMGDGSVQDNINLGTFEQIKFPFPPVQEQIAIASILSSLDDKIDLLHRQNKTLEQLAETLFRQWFVEEAEESWEEKSLYDVIELIGGGTPKTEIKENWNGNIKWLSGGDIASNHKSFVMSVEKTITDLGLQNSSAKLLPKYSTVISARGTVGKYCLLSEPMVFSQSNYGIKPKYKDCFFFTYLLIAYSVEELQASAYGSVFDTITTNTFKGQKISCPNTNEILKFEEKIKPYFEKIYSNQTQIRTLTQTRDSLLPKLMSGEIRLNYDSYDSGDYYDSVNKKSEKSNQSKKS